MKEIQSEILISAEPKQVWNVIADLENWSQWNPTTKQIVGKAALGSKIQLSFSMEGQSQGNKFSAEIVEFVEGERLRWKAVMGLSFLFVSERVIELHKSDKGTRVVNIEKAGGIFATLFWGKMKDSVQSIQDATSKALKAKVDNR